jgi:transposase
LFADSPDGATGSGVLYTLVETAKLNGLDVFQYLKYLLEVMPEADYHNNPAILDDYLPWSSTLPEICRVPDRKQK